MYFPTYLNYFFVNVLVPVGSEKSFISKLYMDQSVKLKPSWDKKFEDWTRC